jgi:[ribosomal protein S5]-alanine N-acetyltransferase
MCSVRLRPRISGETLASVDVSAISARRLDLVSMGPALLVALLEGRRDEAAGVLGATFPDWWPDAIDARFLRVRLEDMRSDPDAQQWLLRALVRRGPVRLFVGHAGFHGTPRLEESRRTLELGYAIFPSQRGHGYATEAVEALIDWAHERHGIRHFIASVGPDNHPSLAIVRKLGFVRTGQQWDDEDGLELVFERQIPAHEIAPRIAARYRGRRTDPVPPGHP